MRAILLAILLTGCTYSEGVRVGQLTKFSLRGHVIMSGEGQILLGKDSSPFSIPKDEGEDFINPWYFSVASNKVDIFSDQVGFNRLFIFREIIPSLVVRDTNYVVSGVNKLEKLPMQSEVTAEGTITYTTSEGVRIGRFVGLVKSGYAFKSNEALLQIGDIGSQFKRMSIIDEKVYSYALKCLTTQSRVKLYYRESPLLRLALVDTNYEIYKIQQFPKEKTDEL